MHRPLLAVLAAVVAVSVVGPLPAAAHATVRPCSRGTVALTFDDGPRAVTTDRILKTLASRKVKATFFVVGSNAAAHPALLRREVREGHQIGNHTYQHEKLTNLSDSAIRSTLARTRAAIRRAGVPQTTLFRPPYGATNARVRADAARLGLHQVIWTVDPEDWSDGRSSSVITSNVLGHLRRNALVLLHDGVGNSGATATALPHIIDGARARGYCFGVLSSTGKVVASLPTVSIAGGTVSEGSARRPADATLRLTLSAPTAARVSVLVTTHAGSASAPGDYAWTRRRVSFASGSTTATVTVRVKGDAVHEGRESFTVGLSAPRNSRLGHTSALVRILDDDPPGG